MGFSFSLRPSTLAASQLTQSLVRAKHHIIISLSHHSMEPIWPTLLLEWFGPPPPPPPSAWATLSALWWAPAAIAALGLLAIAHATQPAPPGSRVVFVTGCDTGFGRRLVGKLLRDPANFVVAGCLTRAAADELGSVPRCTSVQMDVTSAADVCEAATVVRAVCDAHSGSLHAVVNNAGVIAYGPVELDTDESFRRVMDINLHGTMAVCRACLPLLRARGAGGRIVNVCSVVSHICIPLSAAYCVSKAAVRAFSDGLRRDLDFLGSRVSVHCVEPGFVNTTMIDHAGMLRGMERNWKAAPAEAAAACGGANGLTRCRNVIAATSLFAANDPNPVVDAMLHAATAPRPREVYTVGRDAASLWHIVKFLPTYVVDVALELLGWLYAGSLTTDHRRGHGLSLRSRQILEHVGWLGVGCAAACRWVEAGGAALELALYVLLGWAGLCMLLPGRFQTTV